MWFDSNCHYCLRLMQMFSMPFISPWKCMPKSLWQYISSFEGVLTNWNKSTVSWIQVSFFMNGNDACLHKWCSDFCHKSPKVWCDWAGKSPPICLFWLDLQFSVCLILPPKHTDSHTETHTHTHTWNCMSGCCLVLNETWSVFLANCTNKMSFLEGKFTEYFLQLSHFVVCPHFFHHTHLAVSHEFKIKTELLN